MKNYSKILCVVLALAMALTAASCSLSKQYAYQEDDIEIPIGVDVYYLFSAYNSAQNFAQQSDVYDSETGKYDGSKSFLKVEITDDDGETAVAEDWIKEKAEEDTKNAVAIYTKFNELGCTLDQTEVDSTKEYYKSYWDQSYAEMLEPYGISFDSFFMAGYTIPVMETEAFKAEYGNGGPSEVSTPDLAAYFKEHYTSFKYCSVNLYQAVETEDADASGETSTENTPLPDEEIEAYQKDFGEYAASLSKGIAYSDVIKEYMEKYDIEEDPTTESVEEIDKDTTDEILKTILEMNDGQAVTLEIGETPESKQLYLIYREPIESQVGIYTDPEQHKDDVLSSMKHDEFDQMLKDLSKDMNVTLNNACDSFSPSMFEETKK